MSLGRNKKGIELETLIDIILVVVATGLLIGVFVYFSNKADEKTSETLCRTFNAIRFRTQIGTPVGNINLAPRACKTIDKKDLPGKDYQDYGNLPNQGSKAELRDMVAKCWWMWLEGNKLNMFDQSTLALLSQNKCFVCYTFSVSKDAEFEFDEFAASLNEPYYAFDSSDRCAPLGQGGKCMASCESELPVEAVSSRCKPGQKCCIAKDVKDECINKGGSCISKSGYLPYGKWSCRGGTKCYVEEKNVASYLDYVQGSKGAGGGVGFMASQTGLKDFKSGKKYGIALISPGKSASWDTLGLGTTTALLGVATAASTKIPLVGIPLVVPVLGGATIYTYSLTSDSGIPKINYVYLSEYEKIKENCAIESGVGEK